MKDFKERAENFIINYEIIDVDTATIATLLQQVWEEGRVAGLEAAEKECIERLGVDSPTGAAIRALKEKK